MMSTVLVAEADRLEAAIAAVLDDAALGGGVQIACTGVVAQAGPLRHHRVVAGGGKVGQGGAGGQHPHAHAELLELGVLGIPQRGELLAGMAQPQRVFALAFGVVLDECLAQITRNAIGLIEGDVEYELTDRGWVSWLNDLHKGRHTGVVWSWFIDIFAVCCLVFCITGFLILKVHASNRPTVWPVARTASRSS